MKKKWLVVAQNLHPWNLLTLGLSQYRKSGSMFSTSQPVEDSSDCSRLGNTLCLCSTLPTRPRSAGELPQEPGSWFCTLNPRLPSGTALEEIARWPTGAQTWTQTWTLPPDQRGVKIFSPPKSQHKLCGVWIPFQSVTDSKFELSKVTVRFLILMPQTGARSLKQLCSKRTFHSIVVGLYTSKREKKMLHSFKRCLLLKTGFECHSQVYC